MLTRTVLQHFRLGYDKACPIPPNRLSMGVPRLSLSILLHALLLGYGSSQDCRDGWHYYGEENTCIGRDTGGPVGWFAAVEGCEKSGGTIINIRTKDKENFVRDKRPAQDVRTWIGVADFEEKNVFKHMMGGDYLLPNKESGLGKWGSVKGRTGNCVSMGPYIEGWRAEDCNNELTYLCEMDVGTTSNKCTKEGWKFINKMNKYVTVFPHLRKHPFAAKACEGYGGNLVAVHDPSTSSAIRGLEGDAESYWIGLVRDDPDTTSWRWLDGTTLIKDDYQKWSYDPRKFENCAAIKITSGVWEPRQCDVGMLMSICEARVSCSSRPTFMINTGGNGRWLVNGTVTCTTRTLLYVSCNAQTGADTITNINMTCNWDTEILDAGFLYTSAHVNINHHRRTCWCQTTSRFGDVEAAWMTVDYQTNPFLRNETDSGSTFAVTEGSNVLVTFEAFISPDVQAFELSRNGSVVDDSEYSFFVSAIENSIYSLVEVIMFKVSLNSAGKYTLLVDNGMDSTMEFEFVLSVTEKVPQVLVPVTALVIIGGLLLAIFLALSVLVRVWRKGKKKQEIEVVKEQPQEPDECEPDITETEFVPMATTRAGQSTMLD